MTRYSPTHASLALVVALLLVAAPISAAPVGANHESDSAFFDGLVGDEKGTLTAQIGAEVVEQAGGIMRSVDKTFDDDLDADADRYAERLTDEFNSESDDLAPYANDRLDFGANYNTFRLCLHDRDGGSATRYAVWDISDGEATNPRMLTPSEFNDTGRTVDWNISMDWYASKHAAEELDAFVEEFAEPDEDITKSYRTEMVGRYGSGLQSGLWGQPPEGCS